MKLERSGGDVPWMVSAPEDEWIDFDVKLASISLGENDKKWSCYNAQMKNIEPLAVPDGMHEVPFWAMNNFADHVEESGQDKGWLSIRYMRSKDQGGHNRAIFQDGA